jgi:hypothetical protein
MGLFDKKFCDICGDKIGLLGNRKLEDGNMCKNCAGQLSPFTTDRRRTTLSEIKGHLAYREANKGEVAKFNATRTLGDKTKVILDEDARKFIVTASGRWQSENPDVIAYSQVTGCQVDINESKSEEKTKDKDGRPVSYTPPRYKYSYDFYVIINVNSPWFNEIKAQINRNSIAGRGSIDYRESDRQANEIRQALTQVRQEVRENIAAANAPKTAQNCPLCGATTIPTAGGRCEYCNGAI